MFVYFVISLKLSAKLLFCNFVDHCVIKYHKYHKYYNFKEYF